MVNFFSTIRFRLTLWFTCILAIITVVIGVLLYIGLQQLLFVNLDSALMNIAQRSVEVAQSDAQLTQFSRDQLLQRVTQLGISPMRLTDLDGRVLAEDSIFPQLPVLAAAIADAKAGRMRCETFDMDAAANVAAASYRVCTRPVRVNGVRVAAVQVAQSLERDYQTLQNLQRLMLYLLPVALLFSAVAGYLLAGRALYPAEQVRRNVERLMTGQIDARNLDQKVGQNVDADEIGRLAHTFDSLLERLQETMSRERQFSMDASHELRSPLTALKGELSVALSRERSADEYRDILGQLEGSVDEMSLLVEDLLTIARASPNESQTSSNESQTGTVERMERMERMERVDVALLLRQVCERLQVVADDKTINLKCAAEIVPIYVKGSRLKLQRVFTNLLDNALRYTPAGGSIRLQARAERQVAVIEFADTGIGIPTEHLGRVFDRFYRTDAARARESGGSGLGLAIVKAVIEAHRGSVRVTSRVNAGSTFTVYLPLTA